MNLGDLPAVKQEPIKTSDVERVSVSINWNNQCSSSKPCPLSLRTSFVVGNTSCMLPLILPQPCIQWMLLLSLRSALVHTRRAVCILSECNLCMAGSLNLQVTTATSWTTMLLPRPPPLNQPTRCMTAIHFTFFPGWTQSLVL